MDIVRTRYMVNDIAKAVSFYTEAQTDRVRRFVWARLACHSLPRRVSASVGPANIAGQSDKSVCMRPAAGLHFAKSAKFDW